MSGQNLLFIMSDEHRRDAMGCMGHPMVKTPHLDRLAARGTLFRQAYTPSPICVSARASLATGRHVHDIGCWSSAEAYDGRVPGWGHKLQQAGHEVTSIGKLHYRSSQDNNGFGEEIIPMHISGGIGWLPGLIRRSLPPYDAARGYAEEIGEGSTTYTDYDSDICNLACDWLKRDRADDKPWMLFVSFVSPHYPLIAPEEFYDLYRDADLPPPHNYRLGNAPDHPALKEIRGFFNYDDYFDEESCLTARRAYYALCSYLDHQIGRVVTALEESGQADNTRIIYTSDHGDMLGDHEFWAKSVMYEASSGVPMIMAGPDVPAGKKCDTPVSLIDCYQTVTQALDVPLTDREEKELPGHSLLDIAQGDRPDRAILSEYHDGGSSTGTFMIRHGQWKYIHYDGHPPQLFDLENDPMEDRDLADDPAYGSVLAACRDRLHSMLDPHAVTEQAFADQEKKIADYGGLDVCMNGYNFNYTPVG